jgi:AP-1 complex subunit beta-1
VARSRSRLLTNIFSSTTRSASEGPESESQTSSIIPAQDSLIGDLLSMDIGGPTVQAASPAPVAQTGFGGAMDLLGGGLDSLVIMNFKF